MGGGGIGGVDITKGNIYPDVYMLPPEIRGGGIAGAPLSLPFIPPTRGGQVMTPEQLFAINKVAQQNIKDVQAEISERISGKLTEGRLDKVSDQELRRYLDTHRSYLNEVIPDVLALGQSSKEIAGLGQELVNQYGEVSLLASGVDQIGSPESKAPFGQKEYETLARNFSEAQQALALVSQEINDRLSGTDNHKVLNFATNEQLYGFLGYYQEQYLNKETGQWQRALNRGVGDPATNQRILDGLIRQNGEIQATRLAISESGVIAPDQSIRYLNNYNRGYSPFSPRVPQYGGPGGGGQLGYVNPYPRDEPFAGGYGAGGGYGGGQYTNVNPSPRGTAFSGGYGGNPQPYATMNYNTPQYQVNYYNVA